MGVSTDAIIVYGVLIPDDFVEPFEDDSETDEEELSQVERNSLGWMAYTGKVLDGCVLTTHCTEECPMHIVSVAKPPPNPTNDSQTEIRASRGYPVKFDPSDLSDRADRTILKAFCDKHGIEWSEPAWILCSYWG